MTDDAPEVIDLTNVWRVQLRNNKLLDPSDFADLVNWGGYHLIPEVVAMWKVKGYKTLLMLGRTTLIPKKQTP